MVPAFKVGKTPIYRMDEALVWVGGCAIDADGGAHTYAPLNSGLHGRDFLGNAHTDPQNLSSPWCGVVLVDGEPYVKPDGYYLSPTSLVDATKAVTDPARYVDSEVVPFISLPKVMLQSGCRMGDFAALLYRPTAKTVFAVVADSGPPGKIGEISEASADALGIPSSPKNGGCSHGLVTAVFAGSAAAPPWPLTVEEIQARGQKLLDGWGGLSRLQGAVL